MSFEEDIQIRTHDVRLSELTHGVGGKQSHDHTDHIRIDGRGVQLVRIEAGRVDEVAVRGQTSFEFEQRGAEHGVHRVLEGEDPGGCDEKVVAD